MPVRYPIFGYTAPVALIAALAFSTTADAKKKKPINVGPPIEMSDGFRAGVQAAEAALQSGDIASAGTRIMSLTPATDFEAYAAAGLRFELAVARRDVQAQRIALTDMFKTAAVPRTDAPRLRYIAGYLSFVVGNYDDAIAQLDYARTLGYDEIDATMLRADIAMRRNRPKEARPFVQQALERQRASGKPIPAAWYDKAISLAYQANDWADVGALYRERLAHYPSAADWRSALTNYLSADGVDSQAKLDLYRLQAANGAMASERDYQAYAQLAEKSGYDAEAKAIIEAGRAAGKLTPTQTVTAQLLKTVTPKATKEIASLPALAKKAAAASDGSPALSVADAYFSLGQFPQAAEHYRLALAKGGVNANHANARLGVALARSGDLAGGKGALAQASGDWSNVAGFWSIWIDQKARDVAGAPSAAPTAGR